MPTPRRHCGIVRFGTSEIDMNAAYTPIHVTTHNSSGSSKKSRSMASMKSTSNTFAAGAGLNAARTGENDVVPADTLIMPSAPTGPPSGRPQPKASEKVGTAGRAVLSQPRAQFFRSG